MNTAGYIFRPFQSVSQHYWNDPCMTVGNISRPSVQGVSQLHWNDPCMTVVSWVLVVFSVQKWHFHNFSLIICFFCPYYSPLIVQGPFAFAMPLTIWRNCSCGIKRKFHVLADSCRGCKFLARCGRNMEFIVLFNSWWYWYLFDIWQASSCLIPYNMNWISTSRCIVYLWWNIRVGYHRWHI